MSFITTPPQPPGPIRHGSHCQGSKPGWEACPRCITRQARFCRAFWVTWTGGVPAHVEVNIARRFARAEGQPIR